LANPFEQWIQIGQPVLHWGGSDGQAIARAEVIQGSCDSAIGIFNASSFLQDKAGEGLRIKVGQSVEASITGQVESTGYGRGQKRDRIERYVETGSLQAELIVK